MLDHPHHLHPTTRAILESGLDRRTVDAFDAFHRRDQLRRAAQTLFQSHDAILLPTAPCWPTLADLEADPITPNSRLGTYTNFVNLLDLAAIAIPAGFTPGQTPIGVTLIGPAWSEARLAPLADHIHRTTTHHVGATTNPLPPPVPAPPVAPGETPLFCIGAHMAGLPLNPQLLQLGARFLRLDATRPAYRLFALGTRPGLLAGGTGRIQGEVWVLPTTAIGQLLNQVPPPLGFGTVQLESGPCLGFLAESQGLEGAQDITHLETWRAHKRTRRRARAVHGACARAG